MYKENKRVVFFLFLAVIERRGDCEQGMNTVREDVFKLSNKGALKKATR